jgi:hypothetical protein
LLYPGEPRAQITRAIALGKIQLERWHRLARDAAFAQCTTSSALSSAMFLLLFLLVRLLFAFERRFTYEK